MKKDVCKFKDEIDSLNKDIAKVLNQHDEVLRSIIDVRLICNSWKQETPDIAYRGIPS